MKKSIGFFCCTNGFGHYKRVYEVAKFLKEDYNITIYCNKSQTDKLGKLPSVNYVYYKYNNIKWDEINSDKDSRFKNFYKDWCSFYGPKTRNHDLVISDNIVELLFYRPDTILMGSFFWKDVVFSSLGTNSLTERDEWLLKTYKPLVLTNKYVETQSMKTYKNKVQSGFGPDKRRLIFSDTLTNLVNKSSLKYSNTYSDFISQLTKAGLAFTDDFSYIDNTIMFARPGVGTITHCVENCIPLVALYDDNDSQEIIELAQVVEDLNLGFKQNVNRPFRSVEYSKWHSNVNLLYGDKLELNGYKNISNYIKSCL